MAEEIVEKKPTSIILEWTAECIKHIEGKTFLNTGTNEIPVADWERLRPWVADIVVPEGSRLTDKEKKEGRIIEISAVVEVVNVPSADKKSTVSRASVKSAKSLVDMSPEEAEKIIQDCANVATLEAWKTKESRDSVRLAIMKKIEEINNEGEKK